MIMMMMLSLCSIRRTMEIVMVRFLGYVYVGSIIVNVIGFLLDWNGPIRNKCLFDWMVFNQLKRSNVDFLFDYL